MDDELLDAKGLEKLTGTKQSTWRYWAHTSTPAAAAMSLVKDLPLSSSAAGACGRSQRSSRRH
jgi:hypothetical protein